MLWFRRFDSILNHDFCPSFNKWVYWLKDPFWDLMLAIGLSVVCGIWLNPMAFLLTGILCLVTGVGVVFPWLAMRGLEAHLVFDTRRSRVGQPVMVRLRIRNRWPWPVWGVSLVRGFAIHKTADTHEGMSLARVPGWSTVEYSWPFLPQRRGYYPLETPEIETAFPFGLYRAARATSVEGHVVVWPQTVSLPGMPDSSGNDESQDRTRDRAGDVGDMLGTRPFRSGDSLRRVHWAQTARQQQLIVCERQSPATTCVRLSVDLSLTAHSAANPEFNEETSEMCVRTAASILESLHRQHAQVELFIGQQLIVVGESASGFQRAMDALARAEISEGNLSSTALKRSGLNIFTILVTTAAGLQTLAASREFHVIECAAEQVPHRAALEGTRSWIRLQSLREIAEVLPRRWKGACNVR